MSTPGENRTVILLHGGPALSGYFGPLIPALAAHFRVVTYVQSGTTIAELVRELESFVREAWAKDGRGPVIVGHSWGASLGLLYVAARAKKPKLLPAKLILIGAAPLDSASKARFRANLAARIPPAVRTQLEALDEAFDATTDEGARAKLQNQHLALITPFYNVDPESTRRLPEPVWNYPAFEAIWDDLNPRIESGEIPDLLAKVPIPVVSFQGGSDPIPRELVQPFLAANLRQFQANTYFGAGHFIWVEPGGIGERFTRDLVREIERDA